jgi:hypothetical protein
MLQHGLNKFPNEAQPESLFRIHNCFNHSQSTASITKEMVKDLYAVWVKVDETLPWIELKGAYQTRREARRAAEGFLNSTQMKIVSMPEKRNQMRALATIKR